MAKQVHDVPAHFAHSSKKAFKFWLALSIGLATLGVVHFIGATLVAMANFPDGYSMEGNFLSDLGRSSMPYSDWFNFALIFLGLSVVPLYLTLILVDPRDSFSMKLAAGFGILSGMGLAGLGMTPFDKYIVMHHLALGIWLFPMFYTVIVFYYGAARSSYVGIGFIALSLLMVVGMLVVLLRTEVTSFQLLQKMIAVCGLIWLMYIVLFIWQSGTVILRSMREPDFSRAEAEDQYFSEMYRQKAAKLRE